MICIPQFGGCTGNAFEKVKTIYLNQFDGTNKHHFAAENDNIKGLKNIRNFVIMPLIGHNGETNGVIQFFNFKNNLSRLKVNRFIAMKKFLGSCVDNVSLKSGVLECAMGLSNMHE